MPSDYAYERLPTSDEKHKYLREEPTSDVKELHRRLAQDPRFNPPTPSFWKRVALILLLLVLLYVGMKLRLNALERITQQQQENVVHATRQAIVIVIWAGMGYRYSKDHKFRPAASPVITERLSDGRTRVRGAAPTFR